MRIKGKPVDSNGNLIDYIEVNVYGSQIRMPSAINHITIDGVVFAPPYNGFNGTTLNLIAGQLFIAFNFGLNINWDGVTIVSNLIADYGNQMCGICGNYDGLFLCSI